MIYIINSMIDQHIESRQNQAKQAVARKQTTQQDDGESRSYPSRLMVKLRRRQLELAMLGRLRASGLDADYMGRIRGLMDR